MKAPKVTKKVIQQTIDLDEFGIDLSDNRALKESIAQAFIDHMMERTADGEGMQFRGNSGHSVDLKSPYSDEYAHSLEFKAAGKKKNKVNMQLTGDMLAAVDVGSTEGNQIVIEISDEDQILKAYNHLTGDTVPKRPWFGLSKSEVTDILSGFKSDIKADDGQTDEQSAKIKLLDLFDEE